MSIILVRHGETLLNASRTMQPPDTPLSPLGIRQAQAVARRLKELGVQAILSSDMPRALVTAETIAQATGAPLATTALLHERNFGDLRGKPYDDLGFNPFTMEDAPPNGESMKVFHERVRAAFLQAARMRAAQEGNLVIVTHGLVIRAILATHAKLPAGEVVVTIGNTSLTVLDPVEPHGVSTFDCTRHLDLDDEGPGQDARALSGG